MTVNDATARDARARVGSEVMDDLLQFCWDRLDLSATGDIGGGEPCVAEGWFAADAIAAGSPFLWQGREAETSHRLLYRYARAKAHERGEFGGRPEMLLLHQMVELLPVLFAATARDARARVGVR